MLFALVLFSIIGVQSFKGSFARTCVWIDPANQQNMTFPNQRCGGSYASDGSKLSFVQASDHTFADEDSKGFLCPFGQLCIEMENPNNGTTSFDNVFAAAMQVVIVMSVNTWAPVMYELIDADFFISCLFFLVTIIVLTFWSVCAAASSADLSQARQYPRRRHHRSVRTDRRRDEAERFRQPQHGRRQRRIRRVRE